MARVEFQIRHLMIANVRGRFRKFEGAIYAAEDIDVTREIEVETTVEGVEREPFGNEHWESARAEPSTRMDFGLTWRRALETGRFMLGDEVKIIVDISAIHAA